jgi:hypothetical protein
MPQPTDKVLYKKIKKSINKKHPKHSAYRSGLIVKKYKETFKKKYGNKKPYKGKYTHKKGLNRWFNEKWRNQRGEVGYKYKSDVYRPTLRITKKTPVTFKELTEKQIKRARREKKRTLRVKKFKGGYPSDSKCKISCKIRPSTKENFAAVCNPSYCANPTTEYNYEIVGEINNKPIKVPADDIEFQIHIKQNNPNNIVIVVVEIPTKIQGFGYCSKLLTEALKNSIGDSKDINNGEVYVSTDDIKKVVPAKKCYYNSFKNNGFTLIGVDRGGGFFVPVKGKERGEDYPKEILDESNDVILYFSR